MICQLYVKMSHLAPTCHVSSPSIPHCWLWLQIGSLGGHYGTRGHVLATGRRVRKQRMIVVFNYTYGTVREMVRKETWGKSLQLFVYVAETWGLGNLHHSFPTLKQSLWYHWSDFCRKGVIKHLCGSFDIEMHVSLMCHTVATDDANLV